MDLIIFTKILKDWFIFFTIVNCTFIPSSFSYKICLTAGSSVENQG